MLPTMRTCVGRTPGGSAMLSSLECMGSKIGRGALISCSGVTIAGGPANRRPNCALLPALRSADAPIHSGQLNHPIRSQRFGVAALPKLMKSSPRYATFPRRHRGRGDLPVAWLRPTQTWCIVSARRATASIRAQRNRAAKVNNNANLVNLSLRAHSQAQSMMRAHTCIISACTTSCRSSGRRG
jgi:hypothetical protein